MESAGAADRTRGSIQSSPCQLKHRIDALLSEGAFNLCDFLQLDSRIPKLS